MKLKLNKIFYSLVFILNQVTVFSMQNLNIFNIEKIEDAFVLAAGQGDINKVKEYLKYIKNINVRNKIGFTAIEIATRHSYKNMVCFLIENGVDVNSTDGGYSALHYAASYGKQDLVELLIKARANVNYKDNHGHTALFLAVSNNYYDIVDFLIKSGADVNIAADNSPLMEACIKGHKKIVKLLLEAKADINFKNSINNNALIFGLEHKKIVKLLLSQKGINLFIKSKQDEDINGTRTVLDEAQTDEIKELIQKKLDEINSLKKELFDALKIGDLNLVKELSKKISMGVYDNNGNNPLHLAITNNNIDIFIYILTIRNDLIYQKNNSGITPFELIFNKPEFIKIIKKLMQ